MIESVITKNKISEACVTTRSEAGKERRKDMVGGLKILSIGQKSGRYSLFTKLRKTQQEASEKSISTHMDHL